VDLDEDVIKLFQTNALLTDLNKNALNNPRITIINADAFTWLREDKKQFDLAIVDFPDPSNYSVGKLYTTTFYKLLSSSLVNKGCAVVQSTSPYFACKSFWCINNTLQHCGFITIPYHSYVPSFGEWGYILCKKEQVTETKKTFNTKYFSDITWQNMKEFPEDMKAEVNAVNKLNNQALVHLFEHEWSKYTHIQ
jgi:spermidine synthase